MSHRNKVLLLVPLAGLLGLQLLNAQEIYTRIVRISYASGSVQLDGKDAMMNRPVIEGQALVTGRDGLAEVEFEDRSTLRVAPETTISFSQLARSDSGEALTRVVVDRGEIELSFKHGSPGQYVVNAHGKNIRFKSGTRVRVLSEDDNPLEIAVWNGEAVVNDPDATHEVTVKKNKTFTLAINDPFLYDLEKGIEADDLDQFSQSRDQYLASLPAGGPGTAGLLSLFGTVSPNYCPPNYWVPGLSPYCFNTFFPGYPSIAGYADIYPYYPGHHHHHHRPPFIHPPSPPVAAKGVPVDKRVAPDFKRIDSKHAANLSASGTTKAGDLAKPVQVSGNGFTQSRSNASANFQTHNASSPSPHASSGASSPSYSGSGHASASFSSGGSMSHSSGGSASASSASSGGSAGRPH